MGPKMFIAQYGKEAVAVLVPLITWVLNTFFKSKVKLLLANPHKFTFLIQQEWTDSKGEVRPTQTIETRSFIAMNTGRETATKVEFVFNWKPLCVNIYPPRHFTEHTEPDRRYVMLFDSLAPGEYSRVEVLSLNHELPFLVTVRSDQCVADVIDMFPQRAIPDWQRRVSAILKFAGLALVIYLVIILLQFLILKTPLGR